MPVNSNARSHVTVPARHFLRPLPGAHWSLPVAIVSSALLIIFAQPCREGPWYAELSWLLLSSSFVVWSNHVSAATVHGFRQLRSIAVGTLKDAGLLLAWLVVVGIPLGIVTPMYQCYTPRAKVSEVVLAASELRTQIGERAQAKGTLDGAGHGLKFTPSGRVVAGYVAAGGEIAMVGDDPPVLVVFTPRLLDGSVKWECRGYPKKIVPTPCRGEK
jgi:type IV pilus assembly protein PilA